MDWVKQLAQFAGPVALAAFAGVFLGGIALSFFWKNFGPWKLLEECRKECVACNQHREEDQRERAKLESKFSDLDARYSMLQEAVTRAGLGLQIGPNPNNPSHPPHTNHPTKER